MMAQLFAPFRWIINGLIKPASVNRRAVRDVACPPGLRVEPTNGCCEGIETLNDQGLEGVSRIPGAALMRPLQVLPMVCGRSRL